MLPSEMLRQGWGQGMSSLEPGKVCLLGAFGNYFGVGLGGWPDGCMETLQLLTEDLVYYWNDAPERTQDEVVAVAKLVEIKLGLRRDADDQCDRDPSVATVPVQALARVRP